MARLRLLKQVQQRGQLAITSNPRREPPLGRLLQRVRRPARP